MKSAFSFEITAQGAVITFESGISFSIIQQELQQHTEEAKNFFSGVNLYIDLADRKFSINQIDKIIEIVQNYKDVKNIYFARNHTSPKKPTSKIKGPQKRETVFIKRTIRSGQKVKYPTNIVIMGDVNPGSEIIATGDIVVIGNLRGVVHAGAGGYREAEVLALHLDPTQLRIADLISRPPEDEKSSKKEVPEKAFIENNNIVVEEYNI